MHNIMVGDIVKDIDRGCNGVVIGLTDSKAIVMPERTADNMGGVKMIYQAPFDNLIRL